ncbi:MAG: AMP-binding protein, partial [FCB group bacterium]|nr:AMP-binding protein [FCB group bacterium]
MNVHTSDYTLPDYPRNLARMIENNTAEFQSHAVYQEVKDGQLETLSWSQYFQDVKSLQGSLWRLGIRPGDRVAILSRNRKEMLEIEMAIMSMGAIAVPIFAGYPATQADRLTHFCDPTAVVVADQDQYRKLDTPESISTIIHFDSLDVSGPNLVAFRELLSGDRSGSEFRGSDVDPDRVCLMMYTSGTMGKPKCVQLTHGNILSQQAAMRVLWKLSSQDRFLCYLPWHHSFGGIFEKYAALFNGATLSLEHGFGKNIDILLDNWAAVKPTVFFSVPKIYQEIVARMLQTPELEATIFHKELRFIFTAAAALPKNISDHFEAHQIPVYEGWGLTETSPCCTVTDPTVPRIPGIVGKPIPGVEIGFDEDGEILVRGPNIMKGYYKNPEETERVLIADGWFRTGDVGAYTKTGVQLISRKDRIFKLSNAEKVIPTEIENLIAEDCLF